MRQSNRDIEKQKKVARLKVQRKTNRKVYEMGCLIGDF